MAKVYPHRQTVIIAIICALAVAGVTWYTGFGVEKKGGAVESLAPTLDADSVTNIAIATSSDWKSQFFGTSTKQANLTSGISVPKKYTEPTTLTGEFGKTFFAKYMLLKQSDLQDDEKAVQQVVDQSISDLSVTAPQPKSYVESDISISQSGGPEVLRTYTDAVATAYHDYMPTVSAAEIAEKALADNDPKALSKIVPIVSGYKSLISALRKIPAPKSAATYHLDLINGASAMLFVTEGMQKVFSDPAASLLALNIYASAQEAMRESLVSFKSAMSRQGLPIATGAASGFFSSIQ